MKDVLRVMKADAAPVTWRATNEDVFQALRNLAPGQAATDGRAYRDRYAAHKASMGYRELLRRRCPDLRMRSRIGYRAGGYRWFARVEPRVEQQ